MKLIITVLLSLTAFTLHAEETFRAQDIRHMIELMGLDGRQSDAEVMSTAKLRTFTSGTLTCREDGFSCKSSIECCSYCLNDVCGGQTYGKPDGASCKSSIECQSYCLNGVCGGQTYGKPDGAECQSSIECQTYCLNNRCGGV